MKKVALPEYDHYMYIYVTTYSFVLKTMISFFLEMDATLISTKAPSPSLLQKGVSEVRVCVCTYVCRCMCM